MVIPIFKFVANGKVKERLSKNLKSWNQKDYFFFLLFIPFVLIAFQLLLPQNIKILLILDIKNLTLVNIFFSSYIHKSLSYLGFNLIVYFLLIFILFAIELNKKVFYKFAFLNFTLVPFLSSLITILFPLKRFAVGFSSITSAFWGYTLFYSLNNYLKISFPKNIKFRKGVLLVLFPVSLLALLVFVPPDTNIPVHLVDLCFGILTPLLIERLDNPFRGEES